MSAQGAGNSVFTSGFKCVTHAFTWKIENFDLIKASHGAVDSQCVLFKAGNAYGMPTAWKAFLRADPYRKGDPSRIALFLSLLSAPAGIPELPVSIQVVIRKNPKSDFLRETKIHNFVENGVPDVTYGHGFYDFITYANNNNLPLVDGCLIIELEIRFLTNRLISATPNFEKEKFNKIFSQALQRDLAKLLTNQLQKTDQETKIVSSDHVEFDVNRGILSARSPVFERMFQADMTESRTGLIRIEDLSSKVIPVLLHFIYTGTLHTDWSTPTVIEEFIYAAAKYQLQDLLEYLDQSVGKYCTNENAGKLMSLARKLEMKKAEKDLLESMKMQISTFDNMIQFVRSAEAEADFKKGSKIL